MGMERAKNQNTIEITTIYNSPRPSVSHKKPVSDPPASPAYTSSLLPCWQGSGQGRTAQPQDMAHQRGASGALPEVRGLHFSLDTMIAFYVKPKKRYKYRLD